MNRVRVATPVSPSVFDVLFNFEMNCAFQLRFGQAWRGVPVPGGLGELRVRKVIDLGGAGMFAVRCERLFCGN